MIPKSNIRAVLEGACALSAILQIASAAIRDLSKTAQQQQQPACSSRTQFRLRFLSTISLVFLYVTEGITTALRSDNPLESSEFHFAHLIVLAFVWCLAVCRQRHPLKSLAHITTIFELSILATSDFKNLKSWSPIVQLICQIGRILVLLQLLLLTSRHGRSGIKGGEVASSSAGDNEPLLGSSGDIDYGTSPVPDAPYRDHERGAESQMDSDSDSDEDDEDALLKKRQDQRLQEAGWLGYLKDFSIFLPYLIPRKNTRVQLCILICFLGLAAQRVLTVMIPNQLGVITDKLMHQEPPYKDMAIFLLLDVIHGRSGLYLVEELVKIPIKQFSERQVANAVFNHVINLSMDFHSERDTAEVMKALEQGGALMQVLDTAVNEVIPTVVDLIVAFGILYWKFNIYVSLAMMIAFTTYFALGIITSQWRIKLRRQLGKAEREEARVMHQAIQGWTTVSYFNMFSFEGRRFGKAVEARLDADRRWTTRDAYLEGLVELFQPLTFFMLGCMVIYAVSHGQSKTGDFIFLIQYWDYLIWPLKYLSQDYRTILSHLIDAERLLALLRTQPSVVDRPGAYDIGPIKGYVGFENVMFAYESRKQTIKDLSFSAKPGETIAFVGATGAGKSTVTKLLLRFYDVTGGRISIDGHDIRDVTLNSLRNIMGVVPQDPLLFNGTILENLRYAKPSATDKEIYEACRAAAIHDKILGFTDGYATRVGEQGVKLSGGEVQRLAVARVILKDAPILILDEATSAVDTQTESDMQTALDEFTKKNDAGCLRTTFVIAHRLSTVVKADRILVFENGTAVETGTHNELVEKGGVYSKLWNRQIGGTVLGVEEK